MARPTGPFATALINVYFKLFMHVSKGPLKLSQCAPHMGYIGTVYQYP